MKISCKSCGQRGFTPPPRGVSTWPNICGACRGKGSLSLYRLGKLTKIAPSTIARVLEGAGREETVERVRRVLQNKLGWQPGAEA